MAGVVAVWRDPANGLTYVTNGHHRIDLAHNVDNPPDNITARYLDAKDAQEARLKGALINIAEGRGESTDAAKVFRDSQMTPEQLANKGVSLKGKVASEGLALSHLAEPIWQDVLDGSLPAARAAVIGAGVPNQADQQALYELIKKREQGGKRLTNDQIGELIRMQSAAPKVTQKPSDDGQVRMFPEDDEEITRSLLPEKAILSDYARKQLGQEKNSSARCRARRRPSDWPRKVT